MTSTQAQLDHLERQLGRYFDFYLSELEAWSDEVERLIAERDAAQLGCLGGVPGMLWPL